MIRKIEENNRGRNREPLQAKKYHVREENKINITNPP
jgi:hypothetical protein